jgi:hypothetical protein
MKKRILLVGTVSNVESVLFKEYSRVRKVLSQFGEVDTFLVESDSTDSTIIVLSKIANSDSSFCFTSLGKLSDKYPHRIERIRYCRNAYVEEIRRLYFEKSWDYVVVADLDGMNRAFTRSSFASCFETTIDWSACFANQSNGYYDLYALRAPGWVEEDCFVTLEELKRNRPFHESRKYPFIRNISLVWHYDKLRKLAIYDKMKRISHRSPWVEVHSAFGGLGVYKTKIFLENDYLKKIETQEIHSEHIDLHISARRKGARLFINPKLINSRWNIYNLNRIKLVRVLRELTKFYPGLRRFYPFWL